MKIQNIYHLLQAALLLLLVSCTQEEFPAVQDKAQQLTISVTDGGYTSAVENMKTRVETRAVENGYTTEFTEGDACGFYMVRGGKPVYSNVKLTAEKDAATGGIMWKTDGTTLAAGMDGESYYLYYPYQADMAGKTATPAEGAVMTDAEFFKFFDQAGFGETRRRRGEMLFGADFALGDAFAGFNVRQNAVFVIFVAVVFAFDI